MVLPGEGLGIGAGVHVQQDIPAVREGVRSDRRHGGREVHVLQLRAAGEGARTDGGDGGRDHDGREVVAALEHGRGDGLQPGGQVDEGDDAVAAQEPLMHAGNRHAEHLVREMQLLEGDAVAADQRAAAVLIGLALHVRVHDGVQLADLPVVRAKADAGQRRTRKGQQHQREEADHRQQLAGGGGDHHDDGADEHRQHQEPRQTLPGAGILLPALGDLDLGPDVDVGFGHMHSSMVHRVSSPV